MGCVDDTGVPPVDGGVYTAAWEFGVANGAWGGWWRVKDLGGVRGFCCRCRWRAIPTSSTSSPFARIARCPPQRGIGTSQVANGEDGGVSELEVQLLERDDEID